MVLDTRIWFFGHHIKRNRHSAWFWHPISNKSSPFHQNELRIKILYVYIMVWPYDLICQSNLWLVSPSSHIKWCTWKGYHHYADPNIVVSKVRLGRTWVYFVHRVRKLDGLCASTTGWVSVHCIFVTKIRSSPKSRWSIISIRSLSLTYHTTN